VAIAIVGWEELFDRKPRLSRKRAEQLKRSALVIDRVHSERGAGACWLLRLMELYVEQHQLAGSSADPLGEIEPAPDELVSLGYFVTQLRADARHWRTGWRARRDRGARGPGRSERDA
jgi:hypothetical protein